MFIRIGQISSINYEAGTAQVTYPDLDNMTTVDLFYFSYTDEYKMPHVGDNVLVLHTPDRPTTGVILGRFWHDGNRPAISGENVFRKELGSEFDEAILEYVEGSATLRAGTVNTEGGANNVLGSSEVTVKSDEGTVLVEGTEGVTVTGAGVAITGAEGVTVQGSNGVKVESKAGGISISAPGGSLTFSDSSGSISLAAIIAHIGG